MSLRWDKTEGTHESPMAVTELLEMYRQGDKTAFEDLVGLFYENLRKMVRSHVAKGTRQPLSPMGLIHEMADKFSESDWLRARDRAHFYAIAARSARWLVKDYARAKHRENKNDEVPRLSFEESLRMPASIDPERFDGALCKLERTEPQRARVVELRYLGGLTMEETAEALGVAPGSVKRDWRFAQSWLDKFLRDSY